MIVIAVVKQNVAPTAVQLNASSLLELKTLVALRHRGFVNDAIITIKIHVSKEAVAGMVVEESVTTLHAIQIMLLNPQSSRI